MTHSPPASDGSFPEWIVDLGSRPAADYQRRLAMLMPAFARLVLIITSSGSHFPLIWLADTDAMTHTRGLMAATAFALVLAACGSSGGTASTVTTHGHVDDHNMGNPTATPASQVQGAKLASGQFVMIEGVDTDTAMSGQAIMARHNEGTTVTIELQGLEPDTAYISHVHAGSCSEAGGAHYKFDDQGDHHPPNEIHLALTSDSSGQGFMTAVNHQVASPEAVSVVIHLAEANSSKLACADLVDEAS